jgi:hypothetical protein
MRLLDLAPGQGVGDAAGEPLHVGLGRRIHVLVGNHVEDGEAATGLQHAGGLGEDAIHELLNDRGAGTPEPPPQGRRSARR